MKRKSPSTYQSYSPSPRSAKQMSESSSTNGHEKGIEVKIKRNSVDCVDLEQAREKLETELLFLKAKSHVA